MKFYHYFPDMNHYDGFKASDRVNRILAGIKGEPLAKTWEGVPVQLDEETGVMGDFPNLALLSFKVPVFSQRAWEFLESLIGPYVEALPLRCKAGAFFAINVLRTEDCLDESRSEFARLESNNRIYRVDKHVFRRNFTPESPIFWLPQLRNQVLVTDLFHKHVERDKIKGLQWFPLK